MKTSGHFYKFRFQEIALFLVITAIGILYIRYSWVKLEKEKTEAVLQIARSIEIGLPVDALNELEVKQSDIDKPEYKTIKAILKDVIRVNPAARFAYIYTEKNGKIYFIADSEPEESKDYSPPGQEYTEAKTEDKLPFRDGKELVTVALTDR